MEEIEQPTVEELPPQRYVETYLILDGTPCDASGQDLPQGTPPFTSDDTASRPEFFPFADRADFELAEFFYTLNRASAIHIDTLMQIWAAKSTPPFQDHKDLYNKIDSIDHGDILWTSFSVSYSGPLPEVDDPADLPPWMVAEYDVWFRNPLLVAENQLKNSSFAGKFHPAPFREWVHGERVFSDLMSANWAYEEADQLAELGEETHGAMFCPLILGSDKTTVSVATGQTEFYPLYLASGVVTNAVRRAHKNAVTLIGFLAIPKMDRKYTNNENFCKFHHQLFHASLQAILEPLHDVMKSLGSLVAPMVIFAASSTVLDPTLLTILSNVSWQALYHNGAQVIKGTFKDHLVIWIGEWLELEHGKSGAAAVMADWFMNTGYINSTLLGSLLYLHFLGYATFQRAADSNSGLGMIRRH
ncbi:hypothetical protein H0H92_009587 [Tricholoma furcatifolium]|nr:hypothetical protein H0H92_009587 [Tricholoma furcatifolium]